MTRGDKSSLASVGEDGPRAKTMLMEQPRTSKNAATVTTTMANCKNLSTAGRKSSESFQSSALRINGGFSGQLHRGAMLSRARMEMISG